jgi:hypothetical protein
MEVYNHKKHWNEFINGKLAVNCPTEELANEFLAWCDSGELEWCDGESLLETNEFHKCGSVTCYDYENQDFGFCDVSYYESIGFEIVQFQGFTI